MLSLSDRSIGGGVPRPVRNAPVARAAALALAALLAGCGKQDAYVPPPPAKVTVAQPVKGPATLYLELTGNTAAFNAVDLEARIAGYLTEIKYKDGQAVKKGDVLFVIEPPPYQAQYDQAKAAVAQQEASLVQAQAEYYRQSTLGKQQYASQSVVDQARAKLGEVQASLDQAKANAEVAQINLGYTQVMAPFDGVVTNHLVDVGALVGYAGPTKLASIVQSQPLYVYFNVSERQVLLVREALAKKGKTLADIGPVPVEVGLQTETGYPHQGTIDYQSPEVDPSTGTLTARALLENKEGALMPGLFVRVRIGLRKQQDAILVDDRAIGNDQRGPYVLVVGADNKVEQKPIKISQLSSGLRIVESGLGAEDWVVVGGIARAVPGATVNPERTKMTPSETASAQ
jgi:RND family efflux transporter MFP subunit